MVNIFREGDRVRKNLYHYEGCGLSFCYHPQSGVVDRISYSKCRINWNAMEMGGPVNQMKLLPCDREVAP